MIRISVSRKAWFLRARSVYIGNQYTNIDLGTIVTVCAGNYTESIKVNIKGKFTYIPYYFISFDMDYYELYIKPKTQARVAIEKEECPNCKYKLSLIQYKNNRKISKLYECTSCDTIIVNELIIKGIK